MRPFAQIATAVFILVLAATPAAAQEDWTDRLSFKGDVRLRYEAIDEDGEEERNRMRFRTRFGLNAKVTDDVKFVFQLATGGDSPVSTNQSFDDGFSTKDIGVDLAYVDWKINDNLNVYGGKMKNPMFNAGGVPLVWDSDLNPEGLAMKFTSAGFFVTAGGFSVEERSSSDDSLLFVVQAGYTFAVGENASLTAGAGYFSYSNTVGNEPFYDGSANGNSVDLNGDYIYDYRNTEVFAQFDTKVGDWPLRIYAHLTQNNEVSTQDTGYAVGAKLGSARNDGEMEFSWTYQDIEADAVVGTFNDSDFGGGGTDSDGHMLKAKYAVSKRIAVGGTLFLNNVDRFQGTEHDYNRLQLDVEFKFD
ncbi:MAG: putative porin [Gammaproteobacteria bacterium]|nr:putative porin [Gammaproteobacteria bacterium]